MDLLRTIAPAEAPVSQAAAKLHLRIDAGATDEDSLVDALIAAATAMVDGPAGILGRCLVAQTWQARFDLCFPCWRIHLPLSPLMSVTSITYVDSGGATQTLDPAEYQVLDGQLAAVQPAYGKAWPATRSQARAVTITFRAGYGENAAAVPAPITQAMLLLIGHLYANREGVTGVESPATPASLPLGFEALLAPFRARSVA